MAPGPDTVSGPASVVAVVARNDPARIRAKAARIGAVSGSSKKIAPAATATAGLT
ncbi:hypothetical protein ACWD4G_41680 [Streptomyces sp. NPDC002643]